MMRKIGKREKIASSIVWTFIKTHRGFLSCRNADGFDCPSKVTLKFGSRVVGDPFFIVSRFSRCLLSNFFCFWGKAAKQTHQEEVDSIVGLFSHGCLREDFHQAEMNQKRDAREIGAFNYQFYANNYAKFPRDCFLITIALFSFLRRLSFLGLSFDSKLFSRSNIPRIWSLLNSRARNFRLSSLGNEAFFAGLLIHRKPQLDSSVYLHRFLTVNAFGFVFMSCTNFELEEKERNIVAIDWNDSRENRPRRGKKEINLHNEKSFHARA